MDGCAEFLWCFVGVCDDLYCGVLVCVGARRRLGGREGLGEKVENNAMARSLARPLGGHIVEGELLLYGIIKLSLGFGKDDGRTWWYKIDEIMTDRHGEWKEVMLLTVRT